MKDFKLADSDTYVVLCLSILFIAGSIFLELSLIYGFLAGILLTSGLLLKRGFKASGLGKILMEGIKQCRLLCILILLIGATVSVWLSSGAVPMMMYYGLSYMQGANFLMAAFLIASIMSIFMGTAIGTISTIGIALLGIGRGFGIPSYILLGAIISGAFIADKLSPISGLLNLTLSTTDVSYRTALKSMLKTLLPVFFITAISYYVIGSTYGSAVDAVSINEYQTAIAGSFNLSLWLMLLPAAVLFLSIIGVNTLKTIAIGLLGGIAASVYFQQEGIISVVNWMLLGYKGATASEMLNGILISGGVVSMLEVVLIVAGAVLLSGLLERSGLLRPILGRATEGIASKGELILKTGLISTILTIVTCDQVVAIILPGSLLRDKFIELGVDTSLLARTISDTGTIIAPLFPWNVNALIIVSLTGISARYYWPYAVLCYIFPLVTFLYATKDKISSSHLKTKATKVSS